jgi:hypothetical protein
MFPILVLSLVGTSGVEPNAPVAVAPAPHLATGPVSVTAIKNGYRITLNRSMAETLRDALANANEKEIASYLRKAAKEKKDADPEDKSAVTLEFIAFAVASQVPGFRKSLDQNIGPSGAIITVTGLQAETVKLPGRLPRIERAIETARAVMPLLPESAREAMESLRAVGRTTPLFWKVEPR